MAYYMSRYATDLYTRELVIDIIVLVTLVVLWLRQGERGGLIVFLTAGLYHSLLELAAQLRGVRSISQTKLFGLVEIGVPFTPIIMGLFEGGIFCLFGYYFAKAVQTRDRYFIRSAIAIVALLFVVNVGGIALARSFGGQDTAILTKTQREIFTPNVMGFFALTFSVTLFGVFLNRRVSSDAKKGCVLFYLGIVLITAALIVPMHVIHVRFIEEFDGTTYRAAGTLVQIAVMYGYCMTIEFAGPFLPLCILYCWLGLMGKENPHGPVVVPTAHRQAT